MAAKNSSVYNHVAARIYRLEKGDPSSSRAELARLRRGIGKSLPEVPELWGTIMEDLPEELVGKGRAPSPAEKAVFLTLTLYGMAMQGHDPKSGSVNERGISLGKAAALYARRSDRDNVRIPMRLRRIVSSSSVEEMKVPLRALIQLLSQGGIRLDYPRLAQDLMFYSSPKGRDIVRYEWARDFYQELREKTKSEDGQDSPPQEERKS